MFGPFNASRVSPSDLKASAGLAYNVLADDALADDALAGVAMAGDALVDHVLAGGTFANDALAEEMAPVGRALLTMTLQPTLLQTNLL